MEVVLKEIMQEVIKVANLLSRLFQSVYLHDTQTKVQLKRMVAGIIILTLIALLQVARGDYALNAFFQEPGRDALLCLYTFDNSSLVDGRIKQYQVSPADLKTSLQCPFGSLRVSAKGVTNPHTEAHDNQLGIRLQSNPSSSMFGLLTSSKATIASSFFSSVLSPHRESSGMTFEIVLRPHHITGENDSDYMTILAIGNEYNECTDYGFQILVTSDGIPALRYFLPIVENGVVACHELLHKAIDGDQSCRLPFHHNLSEPVPVVRLVVATSPDTVLSVWPATFTVSYADPVTLELKECSVTSTKSPSTSALYLDSIRGNYQLFLGYNPSFSKRKARYTVAPERIYRSPGELNATEQLRNFLRQKLLRFDGPEVPDSMQLFQGKSFIVDILGFKLPPLNEDTPFALMREEIDEFKKEHGEAIVDYAMNALRDAQLESQEAKIDLKDKMLKKVGAASQESAVINNTSPLNFDIFQFAIYNRSLDESMVKANNWAYLLPSRLLPTRKRTVNIKEDELVMLDLTQFLSVYDDYQLQLKTYPEFGHLLLYPDKKAINESTLEEFQMLPKAHQRYIYFYPETGQNNDNLPLPNPIAFSRRKEPYASISFAGWRNSNLESLPLVNGSIDIFVDPVSDVPRLKRLNQSIAVKKATPVYMNLAGESIDEQARDKGMEKGAKHLNRKQFVRIIRLPKYGRLYDCNLSPMNNTVCFQSHVDPTAARTSQIYDRDTGVKQFSTELLYVYHGWDLNMSTAHAVADELWYQLSEEEHGPISEIAKIQFIFEPSPDCSDHSVLDIGTLELEENSIRLVTLHDVEPFWPLLGAHIKYDINYFPRHGHLYQFIDSAGNQTTLSLFDAIGGRLTRQSHHITDTNGRVLYIPDQDYYNSAKNKSHTTNSKDLDHFGYKIFGYEAYINVSDLPKLHSITRSVSIKVFGGENELLIIPPFTFNSSAGRGAVTSTPIAFVDTDSIKDQYEVVLQSMDSVSTFEIPNLNPTDEDILMKCPMNGNCDYVVSADMDYENVKQNVTLIYKLTDREFDASFVKIVGFKESIQYGLHHLHFRDYSLFTWNKKHKNTFEISIKKLSFNNDYTATVRCNVQYSAEEQANTSDEIAAITNITTALDNLLWLLITVVSGCIIMSNASCCHIRFCAFCCCCRRAGMKRRKTYEKRYQQLALETAQNDYEYSVLLNSLHDRILQPDLELATALYVATTQASIRSLHGMSIGLYCLRVILPLLSTNDLTVIFVMKVIEDEYQTTFSTNANGYNHLFKWPSPASLVLVAFCTQEGQVFLHELWRELKQSMVSESSITNIHEDIVQCIDARIHKLPRTIASLCQHLAAGHCARLQSIRQEDRWEAVHLILYNHCIGPFLFHHLKNMSESDEKAEQKRLHMVYLLFTSIQIRWRKPDFQTTTTEHHFNLHSQARYESILTHILEMDTSERISDSSKRQCMDKMTFNHIDAHLMCIHGILDAFWRQTENRLCQFRWDDESSSRRRLLARKMKQLLRSLQLPLIPIHVALETLREILDDPILELDCSTSAWEARLKTALKDYNKHLADTSKTRPQSQ